MPHQQLLIVGLANAILATAFGTMAALGLQRVGTRIRLAVRRPDLHQHHRPRDRHRPGDARSCSPRTIWSTRSSVSALGHRDPVRHATTIIAAHVAVQHRASSCCSSGRACRGWTGRWSRPATTCSRRRGGRSARSPSRSSCRRSSPGFLLSFTFSFDDYLITTFVNGPGSSTLPLYVFGQVRRGVTPQTNAVATMMLVVTLAHPARRPVPARPPGAAGERRVRAARRDRRRSGGS